MKRPLLALAALAPLVSLADEGMWTFDAFPAAKVERDHGFAPTQAWLDHLRLSSVRLAGGCSGSFVSERGLVMTNHHCALDCVEQLSRSATDHVQEGFVASAPADERRCPDVEVNQLVRISDVTARIRAATKGLDGDAYEKALRAARAAIEGECQTSAALRCDVVSLYHGGLHHLYAYRRFQDVRLVFAPELAAAFFGGDPDNFMFPRYAFDVAFLRVYEAGAPARTDRFFRWSASGAGAGELTFVTGHPGGTDRALTVAELRHQRDLALPDRLARLAELRGLVTGFQLLGEEQRRISTAYLLFLENAVKAERGMLEALRDPEFFRAKVAAEESLRAEIARHPAHAREALPAFEAIARAQARLREVRKEYEALERGFEGELFAIARTLVRAAEERGKPSGTRLREYRESNLPALTQRLFSAAPAYPELETLLLGHSLSKLREALGPDHPAVKRVLGSGSPAEVAARAVEGTRLRDVDARRRLWDGGAGAVARSDDPLLALARAIDPDARAVRRVHDEEIDAALKRAHEVLAEARFAIQGRATYPDATFTLRLSYGRVQGWTEGTREIEPFTTLAGAFERHTGRAPFALPERWLRARERLALDTRWNLVTTNDVVGGNSGSPVVNKDAEIVGLVFDGNLHSLGGTYGYDPSLNRAVAVHSEAILEALAEVYRAGRLVEELRPRARRAGTPATR